MSTTGPMDPERLATLRGTVDSYAARGTAPWLVELLASHDHLASTVADQEDAIEGLVTDVERLEDRRIALEAALDWPLRQSLVALARNVADGDAIAAEMLAAEVLADHARGTL